VIPAFTGDGLLPPGIHWATWDEMASRFGQTVHRRTLLAGLRAALLSLRNAGCRAAYVDGSFVTAKAVPNDFDACWEEDNVDPSKLDPALLKFENKRALQKAKFGGELFPASSSADRGGSPFIRFFQVDKDTGVAKGIVAIDLQAWQP
jgi:hypothetical protein